MKPRHTLAILMLLVCLSIFGQQPKTVSMQGQPQKTSTQVSTNQQELILQLRAENEEMQKQLEKMEKEIELYRGDVRAKEANINEVLSHWLTIMGIMMAVIGIAIPIILNYRNEKSMEKMLEDVRKQAGSAKQQATSVAAQVKVATEQANKAKDAFDQMQPQIKSVTEQVSSATEQARQAKQSVVEIEDLKKHVTAIEEKINKDAIAAEKAAKEAKASQLFTKAYAEKDPSKAVDIYTQVIKINPDDAMAYNNRAFDLFILGKLDRALEDVNVAIGKDSNDHCFYDTRGQIYMAMSRNQDALIDLNHALSLNANYIEGLESRAKCYRKLAEAEQAPAKKADLIAKAEADEKKAESLKKGNKV